MKFRRSCIFIDTDVRLFRNRVVDEVEGVYTARDFELYFALSPVGSRCKESNRMYEAVSSCTGIIGNLNCAAG